MNESPNAVTNYDKRSIRDNKICVVGFLDRLIRNLPKG